MKTILIILTLFLTQLSFSQKTGFDYFSPEKKNIEQTKHYFNSHKKSNTFFLFFETGQPMLIENDKYKKEEKQKNAYFTKFNLTPILSGCHPFNANAAHYNTLVFNYLTTKYGDSWQTNIPKQVAGYTNWKNTKTYFSAINDSTKIFKYPMKLVGIVNFKTGEEMIFDKNYFEDYNTKSERDFFDGCTRCKDKYYITSENRIKVKKDICEKDFECDLLSNQVLNKFVELLHKSVILKKMDYYGNIKKLQNLIYFHNFEFNAVVDKVYQTFTFNGNLKGKRVTYQSAFIFQRVYKISATHCK